MNPHDEEYERLRQQIANMEKKNDEMFEQLGLSPHQLHAILNNKEAFTPEIYAFIQKERKALEELLERRLDAVEDSIKPNSPQDTRPIGGHWIFVR